MSDRKQTGRGFGGKGYYIALILCAVAIGITGYLYYRNTGTAEPALGGTAPTAATAAPTSGSDVQAIATQPNPTKPSASSNPTEQSPSTAPQKPAKTASPVSGETVASFSMDMLSYNQTTRDWRVHNGVDIAAEAGTTVCAAADGTVYTIYDDDTMGTTVVIRHDGGYITKYSSLSKDVSVAPGDSVTLGQAIGTVGKTALLESAIGEHVHFSVTCNGLTIDPAEFLTLG